MYKAVYDTNIYISGTFWSKGNPRKILLLAEAKMIDLYISIPILQEIDGVCLRISNSQKKRQMRLSNIS
ncbi:hypothetical protein KKH65_00460 [bacterium]|nr:hypothetical protein [bacterium]